MMSRPSCPSEEQSDVLSTRDELSRRFSKTQRVRQKKNGRFSRHGLPSAHTLARDPGSARCSRCQLGVAFSLLRSGRVRGSRQFAGVLIPAAPVKERRRLCVWPGPQRTGQFARCLDRLRCAPTTRNVADAHKHQTARAPGSGTLAADNFISKASICPLYRPWPTICPASFMPVAFRLLQPLFAGRRLASDWILPLLYKRPFPTAWPLSLSAAAIIPEPPGRAVRFVTCAVLAL
jgi:hypothetical protein